MQTPATGNMGAFHSQKLVRFIEKHVFLGLCNKRELISRLVIIAMKTQPGLLSKRHACAIRRDEIPNLLEYNQGNPLSIIVISVSNLILCRFARSICHLWLGSSELDGVMAEIVDGVPFSEESVAEDGKWATICEVSSAIIIWFLIRELTLVPEYPFRRRKKCRILEPQGCSRMG
jgi:hypothetical protein